MFRIFIRALALSFASSTVSAEVDSATLGGTVRDASGGVLAKAQISVTNISSGVATTASTNSEGAFLASGLASGDYAVEARSEGFQPQVQMVHLTVGQRGRIDFTLTI